MDIRLPSGLTLQSVPDGLSDADIKSGAISQGLAKESDFFSPAQTNQDHLGVLEAPKTLNVDDETHSEAKIQNWYKQQGSELSGSALKERFKADFGDTISYSSATESLTNLYRMVPNGAMRTPIMRRDAGDVASLFTRSLFAGNGFSGASNNGIFGSVAASLRLASSGAKVTGLVLDVADAVSGVVWAINPDSTLLKRYQTMRGALPKDASKRVDDFAVALNEEALALGETAEANNQFWNDVYGITQEDLGEFEAQLGGALGGMGIYATTGVASPLMMFGGMHQEYMSSTEGLGMSDDERLDGAFSYAVLASIPEYLSFGYLKGIPKNLRGKAARRLAQTVVRVGKSAGLDFVTEGSTEVIQEFMLAKMSGQERNPQEYLNTFYVGGLAGALFGGASEVMQTKGRGATKEILIASGIDEALAETVVEAVDKAETAEEGEKAIVQALEEAGKPTEEAGVREFKEVEPDDIDVFVREHKKDWRVQDEIEGSIRHQVVGMQDSLDEMFDVSFKPNPLGENPMTPEKIYNNYSGARDHLRAKYGDAVTLYRAQGSEDLIPNKNVLNFATEDFAKNFLHDGTVMVEKQVPIEDIVGVAAREDGYHEFKVLNHESNSLKIPYSKETKPTPAPEGREAFSEVISEPQAKAFGEAYNDADIDMHIQNGDELKKAVRGDGSALAGINQGILGEEDVGVAEVEEAEVEDLNASMDADTPLTELSETAQKILDFGQSIKAVAKKATSLTTRIGEISPEVKMAVRRADQEARLLETAATESTTPFFQTISELTDAERTTIKSELMNGNYEAVEAMGIQGVAEVREFLDNTATALGINTLENYFPRKVEDYEGLVKAIGVNPKGAFEQAISQREAKKGSALTDAERLSVIRGALQKRSGLGLGQKSRTIQTVTDEMLPFYEDPLQTLQRYIHVASMATARKEFLGTVGTLDDADLIDGEGDFDISAIIDNLIEQNDLGFKEQAELQDLLTAHLSYKTAPKWVNNYRRLVSLKFVTKIKTSVKQFGDMFISMGENGIENTITAGNEQDEWTEGLNKQADFSLKGAGIENLDTEIAELKRGRLEEAIFTPLTLADKFNKEWLIKSSAKSWRKMATEDPIALKGKLMEKFGVEEFVDNVIADIQRNVATPDVKFALYSQMADFHPISHAENIKFYIENPTTRFMFALKSFAFKRLDRFYRESMRDGIDGVTTAVAGAVDGNADMMKEGTDKMAKGAVGLARFLFWSVGGEVLINQAYKALKQKLGLEPEDEEEPLPMWTDAYLQELSAVAPFINPYAVKMAVERKNAWTFVERSLAMPAPFGSDVVSDFAVWLATDEPLSEMTKWKKDVPYLGEFMVGADKAEKKKKPRKRPWQR